MRDTVNWLAHAPRSRRYRPGCIKHHQTLQGSHTHRTMALAIVLQYEMRRVLHVAFVVSVAVSRVSPDSLTQLPQETISRAQTVGNRGFALVAFRTVDWYEISRLRIGSADAMFMETRLVLSLTLPL
ncbi:uncharacterized protein BO95DRAFT_72816 [Aspergillus brunneoviolaceus CBS 621.78]|uniref:Uncharacterized protein n=1 Tax=Aspergillus brunneoviolaceus CBS 621.78 TaxID=1450534 RepID=A0ACD1GFK0_9EURO|nr:hypothetical protein BO95DRAFT_72816 [Aspergillus brunneoviolaceus CBS 621.78]RAH47962.1 hypothetical protein BO95DRAFT_72816 [Aspergillus brunneoviolaceus CBS 621.78]